MQIQEIATEKIACAAEIIRQSFRTVADDFGLTSENCPAHPAFISDESLRTQRTDGLRIFGYFNADRLIGLVGIKSLGKCIFAVERLAVLPTNRHHGIGAQLMAFAFEHVRHEGGTTIEIGIIDENIMLKRWYAMQGFMQTETKQFPHLPFTVCLMEKTIDVNR